MDVAVRLLGRFAVSVGGTAVPASAWRRRKAAAVVKLLALADGHRLHREVVLEYLWPEHPLAAATNSLHQALHVARRGLGEERAGELLRLRDDVLSLCPDGDLRVDVEAFESAGAEARRTGTADAYREALALCGGELLPDDRYEEWATARRDVVRGLQVSLWGGLADRLAGDGDPTAAIEAFRHALDVDPLAEAAGTGLVRALVAAGRRAEAVREYELLTTRLREELGIEPSAELAEVVASARADAGRAEHTEPTAAARRAGQLAPIEPPHQLTSFVGRDRELAEVVGLLGRARLLTLTGVGGCGKTRLAVESAGATRAAFGGGVFFVDLAGVPGSADVPAAVARSVGVAGHGGDLLASAASVLAGEPSLVVLDNCEHVITEAARVAEELLGRAPAVSILATSREPLRAAGEVVWLVPSLEVPDAGHPTDVSTVAGVASVRLLLDRAAAVHASFAVTESNVAAVAQLCYRLDGMPLAIELAAGRLAAFSVQAIVDRLDDRFALLRGGRRAALDRQQTLQATIDWSYSLLSGEERAVFRRLALFVGGFSLEAAETVAGPGTPGEVADLIGRLVDKSLLVADRAADAPRYRMLETVREYARRHLRDAGESADTAARYRAWYADLADAGRTGLAGGTSVRWLSTLDAERANLAETIRLGQDGAPAQAVRLAGRIWRFWLLKGHLAEGRRTIEAALGARTGSGIDLLSARLGSLALDFRMGTHRRAQLDDLVRDALALDGAADGSADGAAVVTEIVHLCGAMTSMYDHTQAVDLLRHAERLASGPVSAARTRQSLAVELWTSDDPAAPDLLEASAEELRALADAEEVVVAPTHIGWIRVPCRVGPGYRVRFRETNVQHHEVSARAVYAAALTNLARVAQERTNLVRAEKLLAEATAQSRVAGDLVGLSRVFAYQADVAVAAGDLAAAAASLAESRTIRRELGELRGLGFMLLHEADLAAARGEPDRAGDSCALALTWFEEAGDQPAAGVTAVGYAVHAWAAGETDLAIALQEKATGALQRHDRWKYHQGWELAEMLLLVGRDDRARAIAEESVAGFAAVGLPRAASACRAWIADTL